jgi:hypothetical protein
MKITKSAVLLSVLLLARLPLSAQHKKPKAEKNKQPKTQMKMEVAVDETALKNSIKYLKDVMETFNKDAEIKRKPGLRENMAKICDSLNRKKLGFIQVDLQFWMEQWKKPIGGKMNINYNKNWKPFVIYDVAKIADGYRLVWLEGYPSD